MEKQKLLIAEYKGIQEEAMGMIAKENANEIKLKREKITKDKTGNTFWKEKKRILINPALECVTVKNEQGKCQFSSEAVIDTTARYFENLYKTKHYPEHPYHNQFKNDIVKDVTVSLRAERKLMSLCLKKASARASRMRRICLAVPLSGMDRARFELSEDGRSSWL